MTCCEFREIRESVISQFRMLLQYLMTDPEPPTANRIAGPEDFRAETPWALQERPIKTCLQFYVGNLA
jgi:hypothetical protein